jgi:hypothetical protein
MNLDWYIANLVGRCSHGPVQGVSLKLAHAFILPGNPCNTHLVRMSISQYREKELVAD